MLSRVAESLYWTARYIERAEDVTRILDVNFHTLLDMQVEDRGQAWRQIVQLLGDEDAYAEHYDSATAIDVSDWVLWHDGNPNAVVNCITLARENARSVREQISGEMWEAINKLFLLVRGADRRAVSRGPRAFFEQLRNCAHLFQGTADATMTHGEPYEFIRLGLQLERAATTVRVVGVALPGRGRARRGRSARARQLIALLESCSAFEAFVKRHGTLVRAGHDRGRADPLGRLPPRRPLLPRRAASTPSTRISTDQGLPHRHPRPARRPTSPTARSRTCRAGGDPDPRPAPHRASTRPATRSRRRTSRAAPFRRRARDAGGAAAAMWLTVEHVTRFSYDGPINEAYTELRLKPAHRDGQRCSSFTLETEPRGVSVDEYRDRFGNTVHHFDVLEPHTTLGVTARSEVWTPEQFVDDESAPSLLDRWDLLRASRYVPLRDAIADLAGRGRRQRRALATAHAVMAAVRARMTYETGSTDVETLADEALAAGHGVCQDFAHVMIGVCRLKGIPARYVSGYLFDANVRGGTARRPRTPGSTSSTGPRLGLARPDARPRADRSYVRVGVGRDYADVPPTRGVYKGQANEELEVAVRIREL